MLPQFLDQTSIPLMEKLAAFTEKRQEILAENLSNIDTPNYRRRDLPVKQFQEALTQAIKMQQSQNALSSQTSGYKLGLSHGIELTGPEFPSILESQKKSLEEIFPRELMTPREAENESLIFRDNNNRSVEMLVMELTKNNMQHTFAIETMRSQMQMLETAISGRV